MWGLKRDKTKVTKIKQEHIQQTQMTGPDTISREEVTHGEMSTITCGHQIVCEWAGI